ncbi:hypothetical protein PhCBS80983_g02192 [Powellomyces hirtus]|uniref:Phosphatidic acid phosphatase type 2/haloperoxidase domain-containing protein n=1 Tax=Powellomyces hirtus TaxID=109895 RepID=A0A507E7D7_9FUNG|nr:hypothetical protein PhCBS80983_g02192 [Powellomyces hirtus]
MPRHPTHTSATPLLIPSARANPPPRPSLFAPQYLFDYVATIAVLGTSVFLDNVPEPFHRDFRVDDPRISMPMKPETVPSSLGWAVAFGGAAVIIALTWIVRALTKAPSDARRRRGSVSEETWWSETRRDIDGWGHVLGWDVHHAALGTVLSIALTQLLTNAIKLMVGQLRPDFLARCMPSLDLAQTCTNPNTSTIRDGRMSFPSGHSGRAAAGLGFAMWYLVAATGALNFDRRRPEGRVWKALVCLVPLLGVAAIAINRLQRNRHHVPDVVTGSVLGLLISYVCYRYYYPAFSVKSTEAGKPKTGPLGDNSDNETGSRPGSGGNDES